ncbi:DNA utilization protein HofM [Salmonella enterica]
MAFRQWKTGLHIQQDGVFSVALTEDRRGPSLRRWWHLPLSPGVIVQGRIKEPEQLIATLRPWRQSLPQWHYVRLAFPAGQTLQKRLPHPAVAMRENELARWVSHTMARELEMAESDLCFDFTEDEPGKTYGVTAAQNKDVAILLDVAQALNLNLASITPDASALQALLPWLVAPARCLVWHDERQWLWATKENWGRRDLQEIGNIALLASLLGFSSEEVVLCSENEDGFDCWRVIPSRYPPFPPSARCYAVALGLALGG